MQDETRELYIEAMGRQASIATLCAVGMSMLAMIAVRGQWASVAIILGVQVALIPFNLWVSAALVERWSLQGAERLRAVLNLAAVLPVTFTAFTVFCSLISVTRFQAMRELLRRSDLQRREIERAHAATSEALDRLARESNARAEIERELHHAHKLEAVGRLAAGIAHEINTPVQFVSDSLQFVRDATENLFALVDAHRGAVQALLAGAPPREVTASLDKASEELSLGYLRGELPAGVAQSVEGVERIAAIVRSIKEFAHPDRKEMAPTDLNHAITTTLALARSEYKDVARVETALAPVPPVVCHAGELNQVLLNLIVNAAHAVADAHRSELGTIRVCSQRIGDDVMISIADTGVGIRPEMRDRIFEPFFTTKEVGRGTGQGLAIARTVAHKHGGKLTFESEVGAGTTFFLRLPLVAHER